MIKERQKIIWIIIFCVCISLLGTAGKGQATEDTISITEFYNNGVFGEGYEKALSGTVVTISGLEEMRLFLRCLEDKDWTDGVSFRQETDVSFSSCTFSYNEEEERIGIYRDGKLLGAADRGGELFRDYFSSVESSLQKMGLEDAFIERKNQLFAGEYDGQGYSISGFILSGMDTLYNGFFGNLKKYSIVSNVHVKNSLLLNACGTICGLNCGTVIDCSVESIVGLGWQLGGVAESTDGTMLRCKLDNSVLVNYDKALSLGIRLGGIAGGIYNGTISDCAVENSKILSYDSIFTCVGGIVGYQNLGQISDCASFASCSIPRKGKNYIAGGIVGHIENYDKVKIYNCLSAGDVTGGYVGGIVGKSCHNENTILETKEYIENSICIAKLDGNVAGGIAGELEEGSLFSCYYYDVMAEECVGRNVAGTQKECYPVNEAQIYGKDTAGVIDHSGLYSDTPILMTALNSWALASGDFLRWKTGVEGYPILVSGLQKPPVGDYILGQAVLPSVPENSASPSPTNMPETSESPQSSDRPNDFVSPSPEVPTDHSDEKKNPAKKEQLAIRKLVVKNTGSQQVKISWSKNNYAKGYQILRSTKKSSGYRVVGKTSQGKRSYSDKKAKPGKTYYYMVRAYDTYGDKIVYGSGSRKKIWVAWFAAPQLRLSKGRTGDGKKYLQLGISRYSGSYVEVYFKTSGKRYVKASMKSSRISSYNKGKIRFSYGKKSILYCKVRTYQMRKGKRCYSSFSKEKKIRL